MARRRLVRQLVSATLMAFVSLFVAAARSHAQPQSNPNHMCGSGEFTVDLPGSDLGIDDDRSSLNYLVETQDGQVDDQITLPNGCTIYAFLISGWADNEEYDQIIFYKFAEFVAQHNGYVHVGWWNNLGKEYMQRPLHQQWIRVTRKGQGLFQPDIVLPDISATPGRADAALILNGALNDALINDEVDLPKANPDEDFQFVADLRKVLREIRLRNPNALIILAGHSMGAKAIVNAVGQTVSPTGLSRTPDVPVDLLAAIDPVGNRDRPRMPLTLLSRNWSRQRATSDFKGWRMRDCERVNEPDGTGLCRRYGLLGGFGLQVKCVNRGPWLLTKPLIGSYKPAECPGPYEDPGTLIIGSNIGRLYHRWQTESRPPIDFDAYRVFTRKGPLSVNDNLSPNLQAELQFAPCVVVGGVLFPRWYDPQDDRYECRDNDGHAQIVGFRRKSDLNDDEGEVPDAFDRVGPGLKLQNWPGRFAGTFTPGQRKERLIELAVDGNNWPYKPKNPDLCLVCQDLITITEDMLSKLPGPGPDNVPPTSHAITNPLANDQGWFNEDVVVSVSATDTGTAGVDGIRITLAGAAAVGQLETTTVTQGSSAETTITAEGLTQLVYYAVDANGNFEQPRGLEILLDKTPPEVTAVTDVLPNENGLFRSPVVVTFSASDDEPGGSGLATPPETVVSVSTEAHNHEIAGMAEDIAGNNTSLLVTLTIDLTPPEIVAIADIPPNGNGWNNTNVRVRFEASDEISGVASRTPLDQFGEHALVVSTEGRDQQIVGTATDAADHTASASVILNIDKTAPQITATPNIAPNGNGWNNSDVVVRFAASDALSELASSIPADVTVSNEGAGQKVAGTVVDFAGNTASASLVVNLDKTAPQITASANVAPNGNGWNNSDVVVSFEASDAPSGSGLASSPADVTVSSEGAGQTIAGTAEDRAGHTASASVVLNIDKTAPQITASANVAPNGNGWNNSDVVVRFAASDALSELASSSPADVTVTVSSEGEAQTIARTAEDRAGNTASASLVVSIDKTAPAIAFLSRTPANGSGWNNTDVNVIWNCSDALSKPVADSVSQLLTAEGAGQNAVGTCADRAGHTAANTQSGINIDKTSPANQITTPAQGAAYVLNAAVTSTYGCVDTLSGVTACAGPVASGAAFDTATVGAKTFTVNSLDAAGNPAVVTHGYNVQYAFSGFSNPIAALPALNKARAGRTVMVKYVLRDANGAVLPDVSSFASLDSAPAACDTNAPVADAEETDAAGNTTIRFDTESGQFIYAWQTQSAWEGTCRVLQLTLLDGTQHTVAFQFR